MYLSFSDFFFVVYLFIYLCIQSNSFPFIYVCQVLSLVRFDFKYISICKLGRLQSPRQSRLASDSRVLSLLLTLVCDYLNVFFLNCSGLANSIAAKTIPLEIGGLSDLSFL